MHYRLRHNPDTIIRAQVEAFADQLAALGPIPEKRELWPDWRDANGWVVSEWSKQTVAYMVAVFQSMTPEQKAALVNNTVLDRDEQWPRAFVDWFETTNEDWFARADAAFYEYAFGTPLAPDKLAAWTAYLNHVTLFSQAEDRLKSALTLAYAVRRFAPQEAAQ